MVDVVTFLPQLVERIWREATLYGAKINWFGHQDHPFYLPVLMVVASVRFSRLLE